MDPHNEKKIKEILIEQLKDALEYHNAESSVKEVVEIDTFNQTITIKLEYTVVEEDDYIGFGTY